MLQVLHYVASIIQEVQDFLTEYKQGLSTRKFYLQFLIIHLSHKEPKVSVSQANTQLAQKGECWNRNQRFMTGRDFMPTGGNILPLDFFVFVVKPLMPILALLPMLCICENPELVLSFLWGIVNYAVTEETYSFSIVRFRNSIYAAI